MPEIIQLTDEFDVDTGGATKHEIWQNSLWHRVVRVMLFTPQGDVLLQRRSPDAELFPDRWDNSAAGHVREGESTQDAAMREMGEELGLSVPLKPVGCYRQDTPYGSFRLRRFTDVFEGTIQKAPELHSNPEVSAIQLFSLRAAFMLIDDYESVVTDGLRDVLNKFYEKPHFHNKYD